jgi:hypothetical protein
MAQVAGLVNGFDPQHGHLAQGFNDDERVFLRL